MLNTFPHLLVYSFAAPTIIRIVAGLAFVWFGYDKLTKGKEAKRVFFESINLKPGIFFVWFFGLLEIIAGGLLVLGYATQIASIITTLISLGAFLIKQFKPASGLHESKLCYLLLFAISLSLLLTGAGAYAFDIPL